MVQPIPAHSSSMEPTFPSKASRKNMLDSRELDNDAMNMAMTNLRTLTEKIKELKGELESYIKEKKFIEQNPQVTLQAKRKALLSLDLLTKKINIRTRQLTKYENMKRNLQLQLSTLVKGKKYQIRIYNNKRYNNN